MDCVPCADAVGMRMFPVNSTPNSEKIRRRDFK